MKFFHQNFSQSYKRKCRKVILCWSEGNEEPSVCGMGITLKNNHEQFKVVFGAHVNLLWASGIFRLDGCNIIVGVLQESSAIDFMTIQIYHINRMMISSNIKTSYTAAPSVTCRTWQRKQKQEKVHVKKSELETGLRLVHMDMYIISGGTLFSVHFVRSYLQKMHGVSSANQHVAERKAILNVHFFKKRRKNKISRP